MLKNNHPQFKELDALSSQKEPFFFMVDFLMENILIFRQQDIKNKKILIDFPHFSNVSEPFILERELQWNPRPLSQEEYQKGFEKVQSHIRRGDSYLVNYTCESPIETNFSLEELFHLSKAKYKALLPNRLVFFSPETFVEIKNHTIYTHPMKGTIDAAKPNAKELLKTDVKEKAEHYTVVDLLRNDLSMVADEVALDEFQRMDYLETNHKNLYAMSSEISGKVKPEFQNKMGSLMKTLLPAGSILGAPKAKTLEIILKAETHCRGFYTGVAGYFDGENMDSCVMIRFVENQNFEEPKEGFSAEPLAQAKEQKVFKSGGGITHLSDCADEYQEMKNKIYVPVY